MIHKFPKPETHKSVTLDSPDSYSNRSSSTFFSLMPFASILLVIVTLSIALRVHKNYPTVSPSGFAINVGDVAFATCSLIANPFLYS